MGLGLSHFVPLLAYLGFWVMCIVALTGRPLYSFYYLIPYLPYRTMRDHLLDFPLGGNVVTILVFAIIIGALIKGKTLPKSSLYMIWLTFGVYLYISMWYGTALGNAPPPLWVTDLNLATWKDYMLIPLIFVAGSLVIEDRKAVRTVIILTAITVFIIDKSCLQQSMSRSWTNFDEDKRDGGPLGYGSNQTAAYLAQFSMFFWGLVQYLKRRKLKVFCYGLIAITIFADLYTFSRGSYLALLVGVFVLGILKDRKLIVIAIVFLATWQTVVPTAVRERVKMTKSANGQLETSANERVELWTAAEDSILGSPILGTGFATYQMQAHVDGLRDTHNWYIKVLVETGLVGMIFALALIQQVLSLSYRLFRKTEDPLYKGLGLGLLLAFIACLVANCFGDRWTYLEITGPLWVLAGAGVSALRISEIEPVPALAAPKAEIASNPFLAYR